ncbi:transposase [Klebsiella pneumoniae]|uniref:transposase n=1 Tax=Klebsiella pneumoniae TaxID=573 RepID=UPI001158458B
MQKNVTPGRRKGCPNYSPEFKQQLVAASCEPGISISKLVLENGINANLLFKWRQQCATESYCYLPQRVLSYSCDSRCHCRTAKSLAKTRAQYQL